MQFPNLPEILKLYSYGKRWLKIWGGRFHIARKISFVLVIFILKTSISMSQTGYSEAVDYFNQEKFEQARPLFENYLKLHPKDRKTQEFLGDIAAYTKEWDVAINYYKSLVELEPSNAIYHFKYGAAMGMKATSVSRIRALSYISNIKRELEMAAQLDPTHIDTRWALIEFYIQLPGIFGGSESKALEYAKELGEISPVDGYLAKGYIADHSNDFNAAERFYKKAIEVGDSPLTYEKLTSLYEKNNQPKKAIKTASISLKKHRINQLNYQIGRIAAQSDIEAEYGIMCLGKYLANYSVNDKIPKAWAYYRLAQINKNIGKREIALTWINKALNERPDFEEAQKEKSVILAL